MDSTDGLHSGQLAERSRRAVWHPCTQMSRLEHEPLTTIVRAGGPWLHDADGQRWFDGISSWWTCLLGHRQPEVVAALKSQLDALDHIMLAGYTHAPAVELAERLVARTGGQLPHVSFASDGASAVEIALKQSAHAWRNLGHPAKQRFLCLAGSYHGETLGALGVTDQPIFQKSYRSLLRDALVVQGPDNRVGAAAGRTAEQEAELAAERLERVLQAHSGELAAFIVEPLLQGAGGMAMYHPLFLRRARELCSLHQVHWIADEIATGCGRTGTFFAVEQAEVWPDLICLSKGITGGMLPLSVVLSSAAIFDAFLDPVGMSVERAFLHSHSFTGNPLACRAAVATLDLMDSTAVLATNPDRARRIQAGLQAVAQHPKVSGFRQLGMIWAFEVAGGHWQARAIQAACRARGLLLRPLGETVYLMPPFLLDDALCDWLGQVLAAGVLEVLDGAAPPSTRDRGLGGGQLGLERLA